MKKSGNNTIRRTIRSTSPRVVDDTIGPSLVHRPNERTPGRHILGTSAPGRGRKRIHDEMEKSGRRTGFVQSLSEHNHQHRCKICGSCFDRVNQLKSHLIEHGSDRPFPCFVCNVRFTTKWNLMKHQKCRAHRVVQSKTSEESVNEKSRAGRQILPKRRKLARLSPGPVCQIGPSITQQNDASPTSDNLTIRTIQLEVIPFSSPIAAQIQTIQLNHISSDVKPFTRIRGTLSLELPDNRTINLSVRMRYEQLTECLLPSCRQPTTDRLRIPNVPSSDNTLSLDKELDKNDPPHPTSLPNLSESYFNSIRQASNPCELLQTVKSISSSRTQEEIQAAKTILSLAQSAQRQSPLISCSNEETDLPYTLKSMEGLDSQLEAGQSGSVSMVQSKEDTTKSLKANITNSVSLQQGQQPVTLAFNPIDAAPLPLSQTTRIVESTGSSLKSPAPLSPKQGTSSWIPICPPPKKRISATYRQTGTNTCEIAEPNQRDKPVQPSAVASSACISNLLPTTVKQTSTTKNTSLSSVVTIASEPLTLSTQAPLSIPTVTPVVTHSDALSSAHTSLSMINSLSVSTVPTANPIPSVAQNLFILPQVMLLPRVISPYISVSHNPGVMAPCYVVHSDGGARLTTPRSTTTPTAVVNGSVPVRLSTGSCPTTISLVSVTPSITTSPVNSVAASDNQSDNVCKTGLNASPGEKPTGTPPTSATNSDSLLCSPRLIDSYAPHANHSLTGTNGLVSISVPFATSSDPGASNQPSSRANIPIRSSNSQARVLVCRNKYRCYECGVVCHKPCLLRKHYRTHSNVRPYVCRHCDVSFKTRGNLSKHMKSKGHYDRCIKELGMEKVPMIVDDKTQIDHQALERQRQLVLKRDHIKRSKYRAIRAANYPLRIRPAALPPGSSDASLSLRKLKRIRRGRQKITDSLVRNPTDSVTSTAQQSNFSAPRLTTANGKIPAPNVNAVHLLQDLPLNLSVRPRQSATLSSACLTEQSMPPTIPQDVANRPLTDPEEVVRTAVVAARIIHNGTVVNSESSKRVNSSQITPLLASKQRSDLVPTLSVPSPILPSPPRQAAIRCPIPSGPQSAFKAVKDQKPSPVPIPTRTPKSVTKASSLTPVSRSSTQLLLPRGDPPEVLNGKTLDPRPYKCATCRVGFRVTGHLHKHFRAKSHLLNELQANKWSAESIECIRLSRINVSQFVNPDNGHLRLKSVERFLAAKQMLPGKLLDPKETK